MQTLEVGTLFEDMGKIGIVVRIIQSGALDIELPLIKWRVNYELYYQDGIITVMAEKTLTRLIQEERIKIIETP